MKVHPLLAGALAGLAATVPMTAVMLSLHRALPRQQRYPLQPKRIMLRAARKVGIKDQIEHEPLRSLASYTAHFGYGTGVGALYGPLARRAGPATAPIAGVAYGLLVWALGYLGWLPATGLHPPETREPGQRVGLNIVAHIVWGASLGWIATLIQRAPEHDEPWTTTHRKGAGHDASRTQPAASRVTE